MAITLAAKPNNIEVEIPGYGKFTIKRLGAAKEAKIGTLVQKAEQSTKEISKKYKDLMEKEMELKSSGNVEELEALRSSQEYLEAQEKENESNLILREAVSLINRYCCEAWSSSDKNALKNLFNDFSAKQLQQLYAQAIAEADKAN